MTRKINFHSLIHTQLRFFNLFANCSLAEALGLLSLSATVDGKVEKPVRHNWPSSFMKTSALSLDSQGNG